MNQKDAAVIKVLEELKLRPESELSFEQEQQFIQAIDNEEAFAAAVIRIFADKVNK